MKNLLYELWFEVLPSEPREHRKKSNKRPIKNSVPFSCRLRSRSTSRRARHH